MADGMTTGGHLEPIVQEKRAPTRAEPGRLGNQTRVQLNGIGDAMGDQAELPAVTPNSSRWQKDAGANRAAIRMSLQKFTESPPLKVKESRAPRWAPDLEATPAMIERTRPYLLGVRRRLAVQAAIHSESSSRPGHSPPWRQRVRRTRILVASPQPSTDQCKSFPEQAVALSRFMWKDVFLECVRPIPPRIAGNHALDKERRAR